MFITVESTKTFFPFCLRREKRSKWKDTKLQQFSKRALLVSYAKRVTVEKQKNDWQTNTFVRLKKDEETALIKKNVSLKFQSTWKHLKASPLSLITLPENLTIFSLSKSIQLFSLRLQKGHHLEGELPTLSKTQAENSLRNWKNVIKNWKSFKPEKSFQSEDKRTDSFVVHFCNVY